MADTFSTYEQDKKNIQSVLHRARHVEGARVYYDTMKKNGKTYRYIHVKFYNHNTDGRDGIFYELCALIPQSQVRRYTAKAYGWVKIPAITINRDY